MLNVHQVTEISDLQHEPVFDVQHDLLLTVVPDEGVDGVAVGNPADEARVWGQGDHRVTLNAVCDICALIVTDACTCMANNGTGMNSVWSINTHLRCLWKVSGFSN